MEQDPDLRARRRKISKESEFTFNHNLKLRKQSTGLNSSLVSESTDENSMYSCELKFVKNDEKPGDVMEKKLSLLAPKIAPQSFLATYMHFNHLEYVLFTLNLSFYFLTDDG